MEIIGTLYNVRRIKIKQRLEKLISLEKNSQKKSCGEEEEEEKEEEEEEEEEEREERG